MADVFIYPSVYEGFGLPVLEAMACGTPVITSNVSSMPEIIGDAGVLVTPNDSQALARSLLELINDPMERQRLSIRGLERAAAFTWKRTAEKTIAVYRHILGTI
jgi:glycosyltransferase involved in cell wall biosynthesis